MKIVSYNVNGIRAACAKDLAGWLQITDPDIVCIQESKAHAEQIDLPLFESLGYTTYWHSAQKKGYSGVGILSKKEPLAVSPGCAIELYDCEGRILRADYEDFTLITVYVPSATNIGRLDYKLDFCDAFDEYIAGLRAENRELIICGDFNICHEPIDIHDPVRLKNVSGFLPVEREWLGRFLERHNLTDSFRYMHPERQEFSWWSYRAGARARNKGWRIDYHFVTDAVRDRLLKAEMAPEAVHSDHCPVQIQLL